MRQTVLPTALVLTLCNMDRICMAVAMPAIAREMAWSPSTQARALPAPQQGCTAADHVPPAAGDRHDPVRVQGIVQSAFLWGYIITQILGGALADRHGGKRVLQAAMHD